MIVTGCNGNPGLIQIIDGKPTLHPTGDTRGACFVGTTLFYFTRLGLWRQREAELAALVYDKGDVEWHGLHKAAGVLLAPDPVTDSIYMFDLDGKYLKKIHWKQDEHRLHTNDCFWENGDLWLTCFILGVCKNGEPLGWGKDCQPHTPIRWQGATYWCASKENRVMRDNEQFAQLDGFTRGLCATPEGLWIGSSAKRHEQTGTFGKITLYDWDGAFKQAIDLPTAEVYAICLPEAPW